MVCYRVMIMTKRKQGRKGDMKCFFKFLYIYFLAALALHCCAQAFSSCSERGLLSSCCVLASHCSGFSGFGAPALGTWSSTVVALGLSNMGSAVVVHGLSCPTAGGISWTKDQTHVLCFSMWILNHWTTREVQEVLLE